MSAATDVATGPLADWRHRVTEIPERGLDTERTATAAECGLLAQALVIPNVRHLQVRYRLRAGAAGRYKLTGEITAEVTQSCIVTLEPVESAIRDEIDEEFWPPELVPAAKAESEAGDLEALSYRAPEVIEQGFIDVGRIVYEQLATALDPYPRSGEASFSWEDPVLEGEDRANPFAALARLKDPK